MLHGFVWDWYVGPANREKAWGSYLTSPRLTFHLHPFSRQAFCVGWARDHGRACVSAYVCVCVRLCMFVCMCMGSIGHIKVLLKHCYLDSPLTSRSWDIPQTNLSIPSKQRLYVCLHTLARGWARHNGPIGLNRTAVARTQCWNKCFVAHQEIQLLFYFSVCSSQLILSNLLRDLPLFVIWGQLYPILHVQWVVCPKNKSC